MKHTHEWQFDGLVGPTHNYAGLAYGNMASAGNAGAVSNPRAAALQGIDKMAFVRSLGIKQAFLPPQARPVLGALKTLGFSGSNAKIVEDAYKIAPELLASVYSSAFMWAANAATILPSADTLDGRVHFTPANMVSNFHRSLEAESTAAMLRKIFHTPKHFTVHDPLPASIRFADEGAANHMRICQSHGQAGVHVFVYGVEEGRLTPTRTHPPRQHREAFQRIAAPLKVPAIFAQQNPAVIDKGVFHHDVIGMNTTGLMVSHAQAFAHRQTFQRQLEKYGFEGQQHIEISVTVLSVENAVKSYFFNSQLLALPEGGFALLAPSECAENKQAKRVIKKLEALNLGLKAHFLDVRESMRNGGGPACLRLRVVLTEEESQAMHQGIILTPAREKQLRAWVSKHYRDRLCFDDLRDPKLVDEVQGAMEALAQITGI
jgi:succinylarginine dihydrolase